MNLDIVMKLCDMYVNNEVTQNEIAEIVEEYQCLGIFLSKLYFQP